MVADVQALPKKMGTPPKQLSPKKRSIHCCEEAVMQVVMRPWCERPPPGYPLPLYAQAGGLGGRGNEGLGRKYVRCLWVASEGLPFCT